MDIKLPLAVLLVAAGMIGLVVPNPGDDRAEHLYGPHSEGSEEANLTSEPRIAAVQRPTSTGWTEDLVLDRERDGHFYADVVVDGQSYRMMVDTGASVVALTEQDARSMGMSWFDADVAPVAQGASGPVNGIRTTIRHMEVGYHQADDVRAIVLTDGGSMSLLGQSFLSTLDNVQIAGDRMVLSN